MRRERLAQRALSTGAVGKPTLSGLGWREGTSLAHTVCSPFTRTPMAFVPVASRRISSTAARTNARLPRRSSAATYIAMRKVANHNVKVWHGATETGA